jgi:sugar phosphate isomerase/epimerase
MSIPVALQLYTVRDQTARDFAGTQRRVAEIGYRAVEFAGYGDLSTKALAGLLAETGLRAASTHVGIGALEEDLEREIAVCSALGCTNLVLPLLPPERRDAEALAALAPRLNEFGRRCRAQGIAFAYHNHDFEFEQAGGRYLLDLLLDSTDPALVGLELDVYWAAYAHVDPASYLRGHADRVRLLHLKDLGADRRFAEVGDGTLDIGTLCAAAEQAGVRWLIVEHDAPALPSLESARRSLENLRRLKLA